jgi:hypothetical protein
MGPFPDIELQRANVRFAPMNANRQRDAHVAKGQ